MNYPTNEQIIEQFKPWIEALATAQYCSIQIEVTRRFTKPYEVEVRLWDSANEHWHIGHSFAEVEDALKAFDPIEQKKAKIAEAQKTIARLQAQLAETTAKDA